MIVEGGSLDEELTSFKHRGGEIMYSERIIIRKRDKDEDGSENGEDEETEDRGLTTEHPQGRTPSQDVACADCGRYDILYGPVNMNGEKEEGGDMTCKICLDNRRA